MAHILSKLGVLSVYGFGIQVAAWVVAAALQTEKFYDLTGTLTYLTLLYKSLALGTVKPSLRSQVNSLFVSVWAVRLGSFLVARILRDGRDVRFDKVKTVPSKFLVFWLIQGLWTILTALPVYLLNIKSGDSDYEESSLNAVDLVGWLLWLFGFVLQVTADQQKKRFRSVPANHDKFITTGVWAWSQHPNYFGEMCMWWGLFVSCNNGFRGLEHLTVVSPMFVVYLLRFVSGVPLLQKAGRKKWGNSKEWLAYTSNTNLLIPNPFKS